ncbi:MAG: hypothetical protein JNK23_12340 [Opitutaceae bacterium]|nr:hypothetical protein [Opitutaceae bacterium]
MNHYCTYHDRGYLAQGLALWRSLAARDAEARLTVLALDDETAQVLRAIGGERLAVVALRDLLAADPELAKVQASRSRTEFIFALTPCLVRHLLEADHKIQRLAYLDADLFFFSDAAPIWRELGGHSVLVTPHRYPPWHDDSARYGRFNVGVVAFRRDAAGRACLDWWREQCLASTAMTGDGACFGDQKYLDEWPARFGGVAECAHPGINTAPWNWARHHFAIDAEGGVRVDEAPLVVFHFAQFKRISAAWFDSGQLEYGIMPRRLRSRLYGEYWAALESAEAEIRARLPGFAITRRGWRASLGPWHLALLRIFWGQFWWRCGAQWIAGRCGLGRFSGRALGWYRRWRRGER